MFKKKLSLIIFIELKMILIVFITIFKRDNTVILEEKVAYLKELHEMKEEEKRQQLENAKNLQKSIEEDYTNWKTLKIDIDMVLII